MERQKQLISKLREAKANGQMSYQVYDLLNARDFTSEQSTDDDSLMATTMLMVSNLPCIPFHPIDDNNIFRIS